MFSGGYRSRVAKVVWKQVQISIWAPHWSGNLKCTVSLCKTDCRQTSMFTGWHTLEIHTLSNHCSTCLLDVKVMDGKLEWTTNKLNKLRKKIAQQNKVHGRLQGLETRSLTENHDILYSSFNPCNEIVTNDDYCDKYVTHQSWNVFVRLCSGLWWPV
jgi:hypothetical protein